MTLTKSQPILEVRSAAEFRRWLDKHHDTVDGIWLKLYKKASGKQTFTYDEALDEALCYGWIDGLVNKFDEEAYIQRFTPRRPRSIWSKRNTEHIARLIKEGKMHPAGLKQVELAKADGRWDQAYASPSNTQPPPDFLQALHQDKEATAFYNTLNKTNTYAISFRIHTAKKPETRERRIKQIVEMLHQKKKFH